ncbi:MAG TPA: 30S ribosomal protein S16 [Actinomycetota bacterium]|nr:30S ribosomal protein S16 [Actinomycetota bacterium]
MRMGAKKRPFYRVVVADSRSPRDGRFIENIGKYHPLSDPSVIEIDEERALHWLGKGAQPSQPVKVLMQKIGIWEKFRPDDRPRVRAEKAPKPAPAATADAGPTEPEPAPAEEEAPPPEAEETAPAEGGDPEATEATSEEA